MTTRSQVEGARSSGSRWSKWSKYAVVGVASLAVMASGMPTADAAAANPALAAAHFRGPQAHGAYAYAQAHAQAFSLVQHNTQRRLDANSTMNDAVNKANEVGASARKAVKQMRGGTDKFYNDLISAVKVTLCNELVKKNQAGKNPKDRFVDFSDTRAYKDSNGDCMRVKNATETDSKVLEEYTNGRCEVKPNCYWGEVYSNETDRHPVYATGEAFPPEIEMTAGDADDFIKKKWAQGLMIFVVPGIILAVLSLLTMIFFLICRCCCNRCGGRSPREGGYTCMQKFLPLLFYLLFSAGVIIVVGVSVLYQGTVTTAVSDMFQDTSDTLGGANTWILAIESPLKSVRDTVESSATKIKVQLAGTDFINDGLTGLTGRLTTFGKYSANRTLPEGCKVSSDDQYCFPCVFCTTISTEVDKSTKQIEANAGEGVAKLKTVKEALNDKLVSIADSVKSMVNNQLEMLDTLITTVTDVQTQVGDIQGQYEKQKAAQKAAVVGPFAFALVTIAIGFIGVLFGLTPLKFLANIIHIAYIIGFIALLVTFLLSSVFLAISVVLGDVCEVTAILQKDWTVALGEEAKGINACFTGTSLIETFNLSSSLEFARGGLKFPDNNLTKMLDFSDFDKFTTAIKATDDSTFNADLTQINNLVTAVNALVKQSTGQCTPNDVYTKADLLTPWTKNGGSQTEDQTPEEYIKARYTEFDEKCDKTKSPAPKPYTCNPESPCAFSDAVEQLFHGAKALTLVGRDSKGFIDNLHTNITVVTDYTDEFKGKIKVFDGKITTIRTDLQDSLIKSVDEFEKAMYCTFVAEGYSNIYESLCGKLMPALTMISLMIFLAGVFLFPVNVCLIIACKRLKARGNGGHVMDNEMKFK